MILQTLLNMIHAFMQSVIGGLPPWTFTIQSCQPVMAMIRYFSSMANFFPVVEAIVPIFAIQAAILTFFLARRILMLILNFVRGSGAR